MGIEQYARDKRAREAREAAEKEAIAKEKERIFLGQMKLAEAKNKEKEELENLRNDLHLETAEAENRRREELQMRKKLEDREEMKNAYLYQMKMKEEHKREANRLMELRQQMFDAQRDQERVDEETLRAEEATRQAIIEEERRRLLHEHGVRLKKFLPKYTCETVE